MRLEGYDYLLGIRQVDEHPWVQSIARTIKRDAPQGHPLDEDELFDEIDTEMMKRGTLSHAKIRWNWIGDSCRKLLEDQSKDFRLVSYMLQVLAQRCDPVNDIPLAIGILSRFVHLWRDTGFPVGKARIVPLKNSVIAIEAIVDKLGSQCITASQREAIVRALRSTSGLIAETSPELGVRLAILPKRLEENVFLESAPDPKPSASPQPSKPSTTSPVPLRSENLILDPNNERALKQSLLVVADYLIGVEITEPLSYRIRRYATWFGITAAPPSKTGNRTVIQPPSEDNVDGYRIAAERGHDGLEIAQKLERSCSIQPFWIEGQMLAYQLAYACNRERVAEAIRQETVEFVNRYDWMLELQFSNGSNFIPPDVRAWLNDRRIAVTTSQTSSSALVGLEGEDLIEPEMKTAIVAAREHAQQGEFDLALSIIDQTRANLVGPRALALWETLVMECLSDWGMKAHVASQAKRLVASIAEQPVKLWEPELIERIERLVTVGKK